MAASFAPNQYLSSQYAAPPSYEATVQVLSKLHKQDSNAIHLVSSISSQHNFPLELTSLFWNKYSKLRKREWGGCVSDSTLLIDRHRMPLIRNPSYSDSTWTVPLDQISLTVGNESPSSNNTIPKVIGLREYLQNFGDFMSSSSSSTDSKEGDNNNNDNDSTSNSKESKESKSKHRKLSLLTANDHTVIMDAQCTVLPLRSNSGGTGSSSTTFTVGALNNRAGLKNPSCLYIVATANGTSSVVMEGNFQEIMFNENGRKSVFSLNAQDLVSDTGRCIKIIQVPLRQKSRRQIEQEQAANASWGVTSWWSSSGSESTKRAFDVLPQNCGDPKVQGLLHQLGYLENDDDEDHDEESGDGDKPKVSRSGNKIICSTVPTYCCTRVLKKEKASTCYGEKNTSVTVSCDGCSGSYSGDDVIWHCPETIESLHPNGYDLCDKCAQKQLVFDELRGLNKLKRDERFPIRVTMLYYHAMTTPVVDEKMVTQIVQKLMTLEKMGRAQASSHLTSIPVPAPVSNSMHSPISINSMNSMNSINSISTPIPVVPPQQYQSQQSISPQIIMPRPPPQPRHVVNAADYKMIEDALNGLGLNQYLSHFHRENVKDSDLLLLNDTDLRTLFGALGPAVRFRKYLKRNQRRLRNGGKVPAVNESDYVKIKGIIGRLKGVNAKERKEYLENFKSFGITDGMLMYLSEEDWNVLVPEMRVKVMFKQEMGVDVRQTAIIPSHFGVQGRGNSIPPQKQTVTASASYLF